MERQEKDNRLILRAISECNRRRKPNQRMVSVRFGTEQQTLVGSAVLRLTQPGAPLTLKDIMPEKPPQKGVYAFSGTKGIAGSGKKKK